MKKIIKEPKELTKNDKIELPCLNCGKMHEFEEDSNEAQGIFNVFCDNDCEDYYSYKQ